MTDVTPGHTGEPHSVLLEELGSWLRNDALHLILLPTEQCNFRCTYCYEDFVVGRMEPSTVSSIKRLIERRIDGLETLTISWFGGEPLLALPVVEDISQHIVALAAARPGVQYGADMTTNGYFLDAARAHHLAALGIRFFQVSLDGPERLHDRTRIRADGRGSFDRIWKNLIAIRDSAAPVSVLLRVHLTPENLPTMPDFLADVRDTFLSDGRFRVLLKPIERLGGPNDDTMAVIPSQDRGTTLSGLETIVLRGATDSRPLYPAPHVCYASRPNSFVIRANGIIGKCTVGLTDPSNIIGRLAADGLLEIDNARLRPWLRGWATLDAETLGCPYGELAEKEPKLLQIKRRSPAAVM
jgi:uncharacterized protein